MKKTIEQIAKEDARYNLKAVMFVDDGLGKIIQKIRQLEDDQLAPRHITGAELSTGLAQLATERWGRLARMVLNLWGIKTTRDFGEIVYLMIQHEWMTAQDTDTIEDFDKVYDFEEVFEKQFKFN